MRIQKSVLLTIILLIAAGCSGVMDAAAATKPRTKRRSPISERAVPGSVRWTTNVSAQPCSLLGFPGADFGAAGAFPVSLVRTPAKPVRVGLAPGGQAHAILTYLLGPDPACDAGGQWPTSTLTMTPPDDTTSVQIPWPNGGVDDCQTGATHPGSYIGPVVAG